MGARATALAALAALLLLAGCGKKGPPRPPGSHVPPPVRDFRAVARGPEVRLTWRAPAGAPAGGRGAVVAYDLFREDVAERIASGCECRRWERFDTVDLEYPANAFLRGDRVEYLLPVAGFERRRVYAFTVAARNGYGIASAPAPEQVVNLAPPPPRPRALEAAASERAVRLAWRP
ncbi:MAG: hypothetical protein D6739_05690, partial [Nitrospirae bacterium]